MRPRLAARRRAARVLAAATRIASLLPTVPRGALVAPTRERVGVAEDGTVVAVLRDGRGWIAAAITEDQVDCWVI